jgi:hypothetical protein
MTRARDEAELVIRRRIIGVLGALSQRQARRRHRLRCDPRPPGASGGDKNSGQLPANYGCADHPFPQMPDSAGVQRYRQWWPRLARLRVLAGIGLAIQSSEPMVPPAGSAPWEERFQSGGHNRDDQAAVEARGPMDRIGSPAD